MKRSETEELVDVQGRAVIRVRIAYPWKIAEDSAAGAVRWGKLVAFARSCAQAAIKTVETQLGRKGDLAASVDVQRLRATAGGFLSDGIFGRLSETDILLADLTGDNPNVMLEVGAAIASRFTPTPTRVFLINETAAAQSDSPLCPSDLQGYYVTRIETGADALTALNADKSLRAALTAEIARRLRERLT